MMSEPVSVLVMTEPDIYYPERHADGTWWIHYRDDDGTAPPEQMKRVDPPRQWSHWGPYWKWSTPSWEITVTGDGS